MTITVTCPSCATTFPVDPRKIPEGGVHARCSACRDVFFVDQPEAHTGSAGAEPTPDEVTPVAPVSREGHVERDGEAQEVERDASEVSGTGEEDIPGSFELEGAGPGVGEVEEPAGFDQEVQEGEVRDVAEEPAGFDQEVQEGEVRDVQEVDVHEEESASATDEWSIGGVEDWDEGAASPPEELQPEAGGEVVSETEIGQPTQPEEGQAPEAVPAPSEPPPGFQLGRRDPHEKARRLARVLVSDMIMYNPERHARALENHTLQEDFDEEIRKSWEEYVEQVGQEMAQDTPYFRDALNEILARGEQAFDRNP